MNSINPKLEFRLKSSVSLFERDYINLYQLIDS